MRNIFLYANRDSTSLHRVEEYLRKIPFAVRLVVLPPGSGFTSPASLAMRSNDLLVLFAEENLDLEQLISMRQEYESFRIILILPRYNDIPINRYILLSPRFVAYLESNLNEVNEYLTNILRKEDVKNNKRDGEYYE
ncbi:MAG: hypothetical protein PHI97_15645 [Desulfobulbus sp.]|nr:hypothetical protein [Desulfobulbus sp.]